MRTVCISLDLAYAVRPVRSHSQDFAVVYHVNSSYPIDIVTLMRATPIIRKIYMLYLCSVIVCLKPRRDVPIWPCKCASANGISVYCIIASIIILIDYHLTSSRLSLRIVFNASVIFVEEIPLVYGK